MKLVFNGHIPGFFVKVQAMIPFGFSAYSRRYHEHFQSAGLMTQYLSLRLEVRILGDIVEWLDDTEMSLAGKTPEKAHLPLHKLCTNCSECASCA